MGVGGALDSKGKLQKPCCCLSVVTTLLRMKMMTFLKKKKKVSTCYVDCEVCTWTLHFTRFTVWEKKKKTLKMIYLFMFYL